MYTFNEAVNPEVDPAIRKTMQGNRGSNTKPELLVRKILRDEGFPGYRLHWKKAPGKPDIAYPGRKIAVFVNGCFWHHHEGCRYAYTPKKNQYFWINKFEENTMRDNKVYSELVACGWKVFTLWECELKQQEHTGQMLDLLACLQEAVPAGNQVCKRSIC
ncbi:MAG: very short patch repair endonuclease [Coriobacteriales bacterium]|jgi:DNA mismatch endonuclease (patch repair protein)|nr:very short patch repair endonuclease [Coriobacteriales bacterium]